MDDEILNNIKSNLFDTYKDAQKECEDILDTIVEYLDEFDKNEIISHITLVTQFYPSGNSEVNEAIREIPLLEHIVGLCLNKDNKSSNIPHPSIIAQIINLTKTYILNYHLQLMFDGSKNEKKQEDEEIILTSRLIGLTKKINPGFYRFQLKDILHKMFKPMDDIIYSKTGLSTSDFWKYGNLITNYYQTKAQERIEEGRKGIDIAKQSLENPDEYAIIKENLNSKGLSEEEFIFRFVTYRILFHVSKTFLFTFEDICEELKVEDKDKFKTYLDCVSCNYGSNENNYKSLLDPNLIFIRPIINTTNNEYICPIPKNLTSGIPNIIENYLKEEKENQSKNWERYNRTKSRYLENKVIECMKKIFPQNSVYERLKYEMEDKLYEVDALVKYDNKILIFESKSGIFSDAAKRGAKFTLKSDLKKLQEEPFLQGKNTSKYLRSTDKPRFTEQTGKNIEFDLEHGITDVYVTSVNMEDLMLMNTNPKIAQSLSLFEDNEFPWIVDIFALDIITNHIENPSIFIHYIKQRVVSASKNTFRAFDELAFFNYYLDHGNFDSEELSEKDIIFLDDNLIKSFDEYYIEEKEEPTLSIQKEILEIIRLLEKLKIPGFTDINLSILDLSHEMQEQIILNLNEMIQQARTDQQIHSRVLLVDDLDMGIILVTTFGREKLKESLYAYSCLKNKDSEKSKWLGFGRDVSDPKYIINEFLYIEDPYNELIDDNTLSLLKKQILKNPVDYNKEEKEN